MKLIYICISNTIISRPVHKINAQRSFPDKKKNNNNNNNMNPRT